MTTGCCACCRCVAYHGRAGDWLDEGDNDGGWIDPTWFDDALGWFAALHCIAWQRHRFARSLKAGLIALLVAVAWWAILL